MYRDIAGSEWGTHYFLAAWVRLRGWCSVTARVVVFVREKET